MHAALSSDDRLARRELRKAQFDARTERLKALAGRPRTPAEEQEWRDIFCKDPGRCEAYFTNRLWERSKAPALPRS